MTNSDKSQGNDKVYNKSPWTPLGHAAFDDPTLFELDDLEWWNSEESDKDKD
jgi:hypothetical protein